MDGRIKSGHDVVVAVTEESRERRVRRAPSSDLDKPLSKGGRYTPGQVDVTPPSTTRVWPVT